MRTVIVVVVGALWGCASTTVSLHTPYVTCLRTRIATLAAQVFTLTRS